MATFPATRCATIPVASVPEDRIIDEMGESCKVERWKDDTVKSEGERGMNVEHPTSNVQR
jgi:hypothetical protein